MAHGKSLELRRIMLSEPVVVSEQTGMSRAERRHMRMPPTGYMINIPKEAQAPASNVPYVKPQEAPA